MSFVDTRSSYGIAKLHEEEASNDPLELFRKWFQEAKDANLFEPEAMTLATCNKEGKPSARMVLLRGFDERGFIFYTNYQSRKGCELTENPHAALVFFWQPLERQVRIEGAVERTSKEESDTYYNQRPRGSRLGAWASPQSQVIQSREQLQEHVRELQEQYGETHTIPRPEFWGGFRVIPEMMEFWQARENRLHDRLRYQREHGSWKRERLAP